MPVIVINEESVHAGADGVAGDYLNISLPGQKKQLKATPVRSDTGTPFALLTSAATQPHNSASASPARRPLAFDGSPLSALSMSFGTLAPQDMRSSVSFAGSEVPPYACRRGCDLPHACHLKYCMRACRHCIGHSLRILGHHLQIWHPDDSASAYSHHTTCLLCTQAAMVENM